MLEQGQDFMTFFMIENVPTKDVFQQFVGNTGQGDLPIAFRVNFS